MDYDAFTGDWSQSQSHEILVAHMQRPRAEAASLENLIYSRQLAHAGRSSRLKTSPFSAWLPLTNKKY
jgi:hypothetical protein